MKASAKMAVLVSVTESSLRQLRFDFRKNDGKEFVEFEVAGPAGFNVRIMHLPEVEYPSRLFGALLMHRLSESTDIQLKCPKTEPESRQRAAELVSAIMAALPTLPWKGLSLVESMTSKAMWQRAAEGRD